MTAGPIKLIRNGIVAFAGLADPAPGGGSQPVQGKYDGAPVTVLDGQYGILTWDTLEHGVELLDRTDPANPIFLAAGTYAVTANASCATPLTALGAADFFLGVPAEHAYAQAQFLRCASPDLGFPTLAIVAKVAANDLANPLISAVQNLDGAAPRDFNLNSVLVVKLA